MRDSMPIQRMQSLNNTFRRTLVIDVDVVLVVDDDGGGLGL